MAPDMVAVLKVSVEPAHFGPSLEGVGVATVDTVTVAVPALFVQPALDVN